MPQTTVPQTIAMTKPVREIVPQIPPSGTIQEILPPVAPPAPTVAEVAPARSVYANAVSANESAPIIPKDAPIAAMPIVPVVPVVAAPVAPVASALATDESVSQILPADSQPMDWQLWEHIRELRSETEAEPSNLRFDRVAVATEPALRFAPRQFVPATNVEDNPVSKSVDALLDLMPTAPVADEVFQPAPARMESILDDLDNVPQPVYAEAMPAYRNNQADGERGMTFRSRIDSEIKRSPSALETYIVQQGDTYMTISDKFYGTSLLYSSLAQHNQRQGIGWQPAVGVVIEVPTAEFLRTNYGGGSRRLGVSQSGVRYTVQEGDTVFRLATDKLQDSTRWREIYALNADQLQDVRDLKPGMEILLPAATAQSNRQQIY
jgi:nucleoid-associated protein YgaU